jgi:hypothetical protein
MRKHALMAAIALLGITAAVPAVAALHSLGSVEFSWRDRHESHLGNFKAASMALIARGSDVMCDRVVATYGNGRRDEIFRGQLPEGQSVRVDLNNSSVDRLDFDCRPMDRRGASVEMAADDGRGFYGRDRYDRDYRRGDNRRFDGDRYNPENRY